MNHVLRFFSIIFFITTFLFMLKAIFISNFPDFNNFYYSPVLIFNNINPYLDKEILFTSQTYPPHVFIFAYPLQFLPIFIMSKFWIIGSIFSLFASIYLLLKINKEKITSNLGLILSSTVFLSFPIKFTLGMGQINIYILLLFTLFIFYFKKNELLSGFFLFFSLALKLFPVFIPIYLISIKKWKILSILFFSGIVVMVISYLVFGVQMVNYFVFEIFPTLISGWKGDYYNQSLSGFLFRTGFSTHNLAIIRLILSSVLFLVTFFLVFKNKSTKSQDMNLKFSAILTLNILINNFSWQHHFVWLIPSFFFIFFYLKNNKKPFYLFLILGFSYFLVILNLKTPYALPAFFQSHVFWGGVILLFLNLFLLLPKSIKTTYLNRG